MAVAELPLPPFPYEKDFFGKKSNKEKSNGRKKLKKYSEHLTKHLRLRQRIVFKVILVRLGAFMTETFERHRSNQNRNTN